MKIPNIETVLIDLDDTLIKSGHNYFRPSLECAMIVIGELGNESPEPYDLIKDAHNLAHELLNQPGPVSDASFPQAWVLKYQNICKHLGKEPRVEIISALGVTASGYFREKYELFDKVEETLQQIEQKKIIVTLGNQKIQQYKIDQAGLEKFVFASEICDNKDTETYVNILKKYDLNPETTVMIGDNVTRDIMPALDAGMWAILRMKPFKEYQLSSMGELAPGKLRTVNQFYEVVKYI